VTFHSIAATSDLVLVLKGKICVFVLVLVGRILINNTGCYPFTLTESWDWYVHPAMVPKGIGDPCLWSQLKTTNKKTNSA